MKVNVLLSSYNGEKFIEDQIESVLQQKGVDIELFIRDDGSKDGTRNILARYKDKGTFPVHIYEEQNIGVMESFWKMVQIVPKAEYYAFCDQDDVWFPDKLQRAVEVLKKNDGPCLYIGNVILVDQNLEPLHKVPCLMSREKYSPIRCVVPHGDRVLGCTMVWNDALQSIIRNRRINVYYAHDQQMYFIASMLGHVSFDEAPQMEYRQHGANAASSCTARGKWKRILKNFKRSFIRLFGKDAFTKNDIERRNKELLEKCGDLLDEGKKQLLKLSCEANNSIFMRIKLLRHSCCADLPFRKKMRVLLGKL